MTFPYFASLTRVTTVLGKTTDLTIVNFITMYIVAGTDLIYYINIYKSSYHTETTTTIPSNMDMSLDNVMTYIAEDLEVVFSSYVFS